MNLNYLCQTELIVLEEIRKIFYFSPEEILRTVLSLLKCDREQTNRIAENYNIFVEFALSEFVIYTMFDQFTMSLACLYITLKNVEEFSSMFGDFTEVLTVLSVDKV
jgi:hypothetical protein